MPRRASLFLVVLGLACAADDGTTEPLATGSDDDSTTVLADGDGDGDGASASTALPGTGDADTTASVPGDESSGDDDGSTTGEPFATTTFTIPAGTVVQEFSFTTTATRPPGILDGRTLVVAVTDLSHPDRDQLELCPGSHPLDGCATVDYGAFGMPHDNRITFQSTDGPLAVHLYKDRSIQVEPEPLPVNE